MPPESPPDIAAVFAEGGPLARAVAGYRPRPEQIEMARAVCDALRDGGRHALEAGTGVGKTFAYLAPILQGGVSAVVSTGTRALQDQLIRRDIPALSRALNRPVNAVALKGRANYLCRKKIDEGGGELIPARHWEKIVRFAATTETGDIRDETGVPPRSPAWDAATSTRETCPAHGCAHYEKCFLYRARAAARQAEIVVVNHHLFLADMRLKDEGAAEILPARDLVVFDEAHLLPELGPEYFGARVSTAQMIRLTRDAEREAGKISNGAPLIAAARELRELAAALPDAAGEGDARLPRDKAMEKNELAAALNQMKKGLETFHDRLFDRVGDGGETIPKMAVRAAELKKALDDWIFPPEESEAGPDPNPNPNPESEFDSESESGSESDSEGEVLAPERTPHVRWLERRGAGMILHSAPITARAHFRRQWESARAAVLCVSATLSVGGRFDDFASATGLEDAATAIWPSPFDFAGRSLLHLPPGMPEPNDAGHTRAAVLAILPLIRAAGGRAFVLFSSLRALRAGAEILRNELGGDFELFAQGDAPNDELLRRFRRAEAGVLAGSRSFWQGVDVKGEALSLVAVDKIPFTPPDDPLLAARDAWRRRRGENPFLREQLPRAAVLMKQVAGRLIRDYDDRGVFAVCDPRLRTRGYGRVILSSLPPMRRCDDAAQAAAFLRGEMIHAPQAPQSRR